MKAVVLAAGKGVRMKSDIPKVLHPLQGKPLILHVTDNLRTAGVESITVVIGYRGDEVMKVLGDSVSYVWQKEQLGTGHAVMQAEPDLQGYNGEVIIACGDVPLISPSTFKALVGEYRKPNTKASVLTMLQENPTGYGRILKDQEGHLKRIIEEKDATEAERQIKEVNPGTYVFDCSLLLQGL
mgnify:FL=1